MKIIVVGCGNVGTTLAEQLSRENHDITVVDAKEKIVENVTNQCDVLGVVGNGTSLTVLREAGVNDTDLLIAVTGSDEMNLLCCLIAKKAGGCHTIARVSNPIYDSEEIAFIKEELGLSMVINPQLATAKEMGRQLKFPSAIKVDSFAKSRAELVNYRLEPGNPLCDTCLKDLSGKFSGELLIPIVERGDEVIIPDGNFMLQARDIITIIGSEQRTVEFFKAMGVPTSIAKDAMIIGAGRTAIYLAKRLMEMGLRVKIIENDKKKCDDVAEILPKVMLIRGDATDKDLLLEEGLNTTGAFIANTTFDEENVMLSLYAKSCSKAKLITKIHHISYDDIIESLDLGSVVYTKYITAEAIIKYVRAMKNSIGSEIETLYRLNDNRVEALELLIREDSPVAGIPLHELPLKSNVLIGCISRKGHAMIPNGQSVIEVGDTVILVTTRTGFHDIGDALK